ncbi:hypothetical protein [Paeniglutamicibacter terrestris]|uniref:PH domain-containing protein n=1 Tax=Paeniglutamicibacter terrestris TaxID=2723403 RepID=A0ABX1G7T3_9MICC|nr:hypothetical protein [Paeniglutamicibacter terrestris]NKG21705.1 hypothetical protein [Paeniglutamicibacter terrestris]
MNNPKTGKLQPEEFVNSLSQHLPRMQKSGSLLVLAAVLLPLGLYLILNDLPDISSRRAQIIVQWIPTVMGALTLVYGCIGMITAAAGISRKGKEAIDLKVQPSGITVRGGHKIPWESIVSVTSIQYENNSKVQLLWDRADLNRSLDVYVDKALDTRRNKTKDGRSHIRIDLLRYPAVDYMRLYEATLEQFARQGISVEDRKALKQT